MPDAVATTLARNRGGIPPGMMLDPTTGQLIPLRQQNTFAPQTNFGAPQGERTDPDGTFWDANGTPWRYVDNGNGTGQWLQGQKDPVTMQWRFANNNLAEVLAREGQTNGVPAGVDPSDYWRSDAGIGRVGQVNPPRSNPAQGGSLGAYQDLLNNTAQTDAFRTGNDWWMGELERQRMAAQQTNADMISRQQGYDQDAINRINDLVYQQGAQATGYNSAQSALTQDYQRQLSGYNDQIGNALTGFNSSMNALNTPFSARGYGADVPFDPQGLGMQQNAYNWAQGAAGGSLDYQAQLAQLAQAAAVRAQLTEYMSNPEDIGRQLDALQGIQNDLSGPEWERQLGALQAIETDIEFGGRQQQSTLDAILADIESGGLGQQDAAARILDEMQSGRQRGDSALYQIQLAQQMGGERYQQLIDQLNADLQSGGAEQRGALEKYKSLSDPSVTAEERLIAQLARQSFEQQDRGLREAADQEMAMRGLRTGSSAIGSLLGAQERMGLERTNAELALQAQAQQRAERMLGGWSNAANQLRASDQQTLGMLGNATGQYNQLALQGAGLYSDASNQMNNYLMGAAGMYADQQNALRAAQQQGLAMANNAANELRTAQQRGLALQADQANALRAAQQQGLAMYWDATAQLRAQNDAVGMFNTGQANEMSMFNAQNETGVNMFNAGEANRVSMFNAGEQNTASRANQQTRLAGGIQMGAMANQIRSDNDAINMFNKEQSQITQRFQDQIALNDLQRREGLAINTLGGNISGIGAQAGLSTQGFEAGRSNINDSWQRDFTTTNTGLNAAGNILGIQSGTNALTGAAGQQNFANAQSGYGSWIVGQNTLGGMTEADRQRQQTAQALGTLASRGGYRMS